MYPWDSHGIVKSLKVIQWDSKSQPWDSRGIVLPSSFQRMVYAFS